MWNVGNIKNNKSAIVWSLLLFSDLSEFHDPLYKISQNKWKVSSTIQSRKWMNETTKVSSTSQENSSLSNQQNLRNYLSKKVHQHSKWSSSSISLLIHSYSLKLAPIKSRSWNKGEKRIYLWLIVCYCFIS